MNFEMVVPVIESCIADGAPPEALEQARDIFETVLGAAEKSGRQLSFELNSEDRIWFSELLRTNGVTDTPSFRSALGCADLLLSAPTETSMEQVRRLFRLMLKKM